MSLLISALKPTVWTVAIFVILFLVSIFFGSYLFHDVLDAGSCTPKCYRFFGFPVPIILGEEWDPSTITWQTGLAILIDLVFWFLVVTLIVGIGRSVRRVIRHRQ